MFLSSSPVLAVLTSNIPAAPLAAAAAVRQEMLLQEAREQDAASAALVGMPGQQQQQQQQQQQELSRLAEAAGLPDGCRLTGEQLKIVRSVAAGAGGSGDLVL
jgi:hypothetical protein